MARAGAGGTERVQLIGVAHALGRPLESARRPFACPVLSELSAPGLGRVATHSVCVEDTVDAADCLEDVFQVRGVAHLEGEP